MKELSIEQKAYDGNYKVYTELINRLEDVKEAIKKQNYGIAMDILYKPYPEFKITTSPELKEGSDEEIRKEIIELVDGIYKDSSTVSAKEERDKYVAWLEKQGKENYEFPLVHEKMETERWKEACKAACCDWNYRSHYGLTETRDDYFVDGVQWADENPKQKTINKVEPKFKVGDWVVYKCDICQIVKREEGCNKLVTNFGIEKELVNERNLSTARLWTIQDAKDGDVLVATDGSIFLFAFVFDCVCKHYVALTTEGSVKFNEGFKHYLEASRAIHPATKEQRDLLFKKITEAGYEWDEEKKELKKIENEIEIPFGAKDSELQEVTYYIPKGFQAEIDDDKVVIKKGDNPNWKNSTNIEYARTDAFMKKAKEAFCKATCNGHPPRSTCTSLGTCKEYDKFVKFLKGE